MDWMELTQSFNPLDPGPHNKIKASFDDYHNSRNMNSAIKELKKNLISRNTTKQKLAIVSIYKMLKCKNKLLINVLLRTDIPGLLCDILNQHNHSLIKGIFCCLLELSKNKLFYELKHSEVSIDTICRTLKILAKKVSTIKIIHIGIKLLSQTFSGCHTKKSVNSVQVFGFIKDVFFNMLLQPVHLSTMILLRIILKDKEFQHKDLLLVVHQVITLLSKLKKNNSKKFNKHLTLAADIMLCSLRLCTEDRINSLSLKTSELILMLIKTSIVPFMQKVDVKRCHAGFVKRLLNCLVSLYLCLDGDELKYLSNNLATKGFLNLLPTINMHYQDQALHGCVMTLLSHILVKLGASTLRLSEQECHQITAGLHSLPPNFSKWPQLLKQPDMYKLHPSIIIYLYFFFLCTDRLQHSNSNKILSESPVHLSALCSFFHTQSSPPSASLIKGIWLVFAVLSLSQPSAQKDGKCLQASRVLISWLQASPLPSVYTHHPALLLWSFSSLCTSKQLQLNMTILWMKDQREPSLKQIENLALSKKETVLCLLKVLGCCPKDSISQVCTILKKVVDRDKLNSATDLSISLWTTLPRTLSMLFAPQPETKVFNVSCVVYLACKVVPVWTDTSLLFRVSVQLLSVMQMTFTDLDLAHTLHSQLFKLAHVLVIKMNQCKDYRVLETFVQDRTLMQTLLSSLNSMNHSVILPALKLLLFLQCQQIIRNIQVKFSLCVTGETLLKLVTDPGNEIVFVTLSLFSQLLSSNKIQPVLALPTNFLEYFILSLNLEFQMLTFRVKESWRCQTLLLQYCQVHKSHMELHLLTQPWTYRALQLTLSRNGLKSVVVLEYLQVWLEGLRRRRQRVIRPSYTRAVCQDNLSQTLTLLARKLAQHEEALDSRLDNIATKICSLGANIPTDVIQLLKSKVEDKFSEESQDVQLI